MRIKIIFPPDLAQQKAEEAKAWQPGMPMMWECEDLNTEPEIIREGNDIVLRTPSTQVILHDEEVQKIRDLFE